MNVSFLLLLVASLLPSSDAVPPGLTIRTDQGSISGSLVTSRVRQFLGIPYASSKRWQPPQPPPNRPYTFAATKFGDSCIQNPHPIFSEYLRLVGDGDSLSVPSSEDCLNLNIWAPSTERQQGKKAAVMIWVYSSGFIVGTSNTKTFNGQNLVSANDNIILVTFNHRLDIFGQPNAPHLGADNRNFGLLDIRAAVQWVHNNIAAFGGDPDRVTLFGQATGARAVDMYAFANPQDTFVKGLILQSGSVSGDAPDRIQTNNDSWTKVAAAVGCGNATSAAQYECMARANAQTLMKAVVSTGTIFDRIVDNTTNFADIPARLAAGRFLKAPTLLGTVKNEADALLVAQQLAVRKTVLPGITEAVSDIQTLVAGTCPSGTAAVRRRNAGVPVWRYQYQAIFPNLRLHPELRAYHHVEVPLIFGTYNTTATNLRPGVPSTPDQIALSRYIQRAWVAFARDPRRGLDAMGWPQYEPDAESLVQLGNPVKSPSGVSFERNSLVDFACGNLSLLVNAQSQLFPLLLSS